MSTPEESEEPVTVESLRSQVRGAFFLQMLVTGLLLFLVGVLHQVPDGIVVAFIASALNTLHLSRVARAK